MTNQKIKSILISKGVNSIYHSNTVETSLSFLKAGGLLSRGYCVEHGLPQTPQSTDQLDSDLGIFYDLFFDSVDIHERSHNVNYYGPVLFKYDKNVLDSFEEGSVRITKQNPKYWEPDYEENDKYFTEETELSFCFQKGDFGQHITIAPHVAPLSFSYLRGIVITNPHNSYGNYYQEAIAAIQNSIHDINLNVSFEERICQEGCKCSEYYSRNFRVRNHYQLGGNL